MVVVVGEKDEPLLLNGAGIEALALFDTGERIKVIAHDPRNIEMSACWNEIGNVAGALATGIDKDSHQLGGVARIQIYRNSGNDLAGPIEQRHLPAGDEWFVVVRNIADAIAFQLQSSVFYFATLGEVAGIGKCGNDAATGGQHSI